MEINTLAVSGVFEIVLKSHRDDRGFFVRTFDESVFKCWKIHHLWVQENHSFTKTKGTIRGLHFQYSPYQEAKVIRPIIGRVFVVVADLRRESPDKGVVCTCILDAEKNNALYVPEGCALGNCTLSNNVHLVYKMSNYYAPDHAGIIRWSDPDLNIAWPVTSPEVISKRDQTGDTLRQFFSISDGL